MAIAASLLGGAAFSACRRSGQAPAATDTQPAAVAPELQQARELLFAELKPVKLTNCELTRFGEANDGGYLLCRNLATQIASAYSYGIAGYDGWGCEVSKAFNVPVHQYDCFNQKEPVCPGGRTIFHPECIAGARSTDASGRLFDTMQAQLQNNGDGAKHVIVKMDVEGAEWDSMLKTPEAVFDNIDQMVFELHGVEGNVGRSVEV